MNILIVAYYWPPAGGSGVQRWLYMSNHLADIPGNSTSTTEVLDLRSLIFHCHRPFRSTFYNNVGRKTKYVGIFKKKKSLIQK